MTTKFALPLIALLLLSCGSKGSDDHPIDPTGNGNDTEESASHFRLSSLKDNSNDHWKKWFGYYSDLNPNFALEDFSYQGKDSIEEMEGTIRAVYKSSFDDRLSKLLIYNPSRTKYIDFDSYDINFEEDSTFSLAGEQEIDLVDLKKKSIKRIGFRGNSQWVEDAFWLNDSFIVLLENNDENKPWITFIDLETGTQKHFEYRYAFPERSGYSVMRWAEAGLKSAY